GHRNLRAWNATKTLHDCADILRTLSDVLGCLPLVIRMMVAIHAQQCLDAGREEACRLPRIGAGLHKPRRRRVLQGMRCDICDAGAITGGSKSLLDIFDTLAVDMQDVAEISAAFS